MKPLYLLAVIPFVGLLGGVFFANRVEPFVLGLPFLMFWVVLWVVLSAGIMGVIYALDPINGADDDDHTDDEAGS